MTFERQVRTDGGEPREVSGGDEDTGGDDDSIDFEERLEGDVSPDETDEQDRGAADSSDDDGGGDDERGGDGEGDDERGGDDGSRTVSVPGAVTADPGEDLVPSETDVERYDDEEMLMEEFQRSEELDVVRESPDFKTLWSDDEEPVEDLEDEFAEEIAASTDPDAVREAVLSDVKEYYATYEDDFAEAPSDEFVEQRWFSFEYLDGVEEIERYWVNKPYTYVSILFDEAEREFFYHISEPVLDDFEKYVRRDLVTTLRNSLMYQDIEDETDREGIFETKVKEIIAEGAATVDDGSLQKLRYFLLRDFIRYGPIDAIMRDPGIEDISCDGHDVPVYVYHGVYRDLMTNVTFGEQQLNSYVLRLAQRAGKHISISDPLVDASLPDGSRIQMTLGGEIATRGSNFTIRKFSDVPLTPVDLIQSNTFSVEQMAYFWIAIENNRSLLFAGGTGSGKTTSMNAVSFFIPPSSKVVSIEDTREIDLPHENWIQSVTRASINQEARGEVSMYQLLQAALRQRPEYLLVGEIRTEQRVALTFFQAMSTGHTAYTTVHADSVETVLNRLLNPPLSVPVQMVQDLDIVSIQRQAYVGDTRIRRNQEVAELSPGDDPTETDVSRTFEWNARDDEHEPVGDSEVLEEIANQRGWSEAELATERENRENLLQYLVDEDISGYDAVAVAIEMYDKDPERVVEAVEAGSLDAQTLEDWA